MCSSTFGNEKKRLDLFRMAQMSSSVNVFISKETSDTCSQFFVAKITANAQRGQQNDRRIRLHFWAVPRASARDSLEIMNIFLLHSTDP